MHDSDFKQVSEVIHKMRCVIIAWYIMAAINITKIHSFYYLP